MLPLFLLAIDWTDPGLTREAYKMIKEWEPMTPIEAICLLDAPFADMQVRFYACERISKMSDEELTLYMLELT